MSTQTVETIDYSERDLGELGEVIQGASYLSGIATGLESAAGILRKLSGERFAQKNDKEALIIRALAEELEKYAKEKDEYARQVEQPREEAAFMELTKRELEKI